MILVIGYGSSLRGDDAAGPTAAERIAAWHDPAVCAVAAHQLTPEMAESVSGAKLALFLDAATGEQTEVETLPLRPALPPSGLGHTSDPCCLLALAEHLFGRCPPAWRIKIPAACFDLGADLSPLAMQGVETALVLVREIMDREAGRANES